MKFRFENLDSIRTIAFLSTFLAHAFYAESQEVLDSSMFQWAVKFREIFSFGVPVFFVLSGFLITYLMLKEESNKGGFNIKNFYMRRVLRIWPVFFVVLLVGFVLFPLLRSYLLQMPYVETANPWMYLSFLSNFDQINAGVLPFGVGLGPTWPVSIEEQFYLFWPLLLLLFSKKKFVIPITLVTLLSFGLTIYYSFSGKHTIYCMLYLSIGGFYGYLAYYQNALAKLITNISPWFFLFCIGLIFMLISGSFSSEYPVVYIFFIALLIGYCILYQCYSGRMELKRLPFLERMGKYTYGLYLYHVIANFIVHIVIDDLTGIKESSMNAVIVKPLLSLCLSVVLSYYSYRYVESYFLQLKKKFSPAN